VRWRGRRWRHDAEPRAARRRRDDDDHHHHDDHDDDHAAAAHDGAAGADADAFSDLRECKRPGDRCVRTADRALQQRPVELLAEQVRHLLVERWRGLLGVPRTALLII
jgi:hypothetical protein